jgi:hypothetical protein
MPWITQRFSQLPFNRCCSSAPCYCTCFPFWKTDHQTRWSRGRAGLHTLQRGLGGSEGYQTTPPPPSSAPPSVPGPLPSLHDLTQAHHTWWDSSGPAISPTLRPLPDNTQHSQQTFILEQAMKAQKGSSVIAVLFRKPGRYMGVGGQRHTRERDPIHIVQEVGWAPGLFWTCAEYSSPPRFDSLTVQFVLGHYIDYASPAHLRDILPVC